jgi:hypothetical protein
MPIDPSEARRSDIDPDSAETPLMVSAWQAHGVRRLWVLGSAARGEWRDRIREIYLLVYRDPDSPLPKQCLGLCQGPKNIFGEHLELASMGCGRNPHFRAEPAKASVPAGAAA